MSKGRYEVVGRLPPGGGGKTSLAVMGAGAFRRVAVLRPVGTAALIPVANVHPRLPPPLGVEELDGAQCAVYDFFPGATLHEIVEVYRAQQQLPPLGLALRIVVDAARVVHLAHEHQDPLGGSGAFIHGGIAASSLLMGFDGEVRVIDFGLRKLNRYSAPEAAGGGPFTAKTDVFSLAAALHTALTGFDREYAALLSRAPSSAQLPPPSAVHPDATAELDSLLMGALMPDPERRLGSTAELADDLERIAGAAMPQPQACATRLKQLFEERLDGLRRMVPKLSSDGPAPAPSQPSLKPRASRPGMPSQPEPAPQPRRSVPRPQPIPRGTQPEANPVGRRQTPEEVKAAFGDPSGEDVPEEATVVAESDPELMKRVELARSRQEPTRGERPSGEKKTGAKKPLAALPEVPWEPGAGAPGGIPTDQQLVPDAGLAIEDVPTGLSRRHSGAHAAVGGSSVEEKSRARGQELVDTGEIEPFEADDLREMPTVVKVSGTHQKRVVEPRPEEIAAAFGDPAPLEEPGTAIITAKDGPKAKGPPLLESPSAGDASGPIAAPDTGVLESAKHQKAEPKARNAARPRSKGPRRVIAFLMLLMAGGFGFVSLKNPALVKGKINAALVKWGLKKAPPPPPPQEPIEPVAPPPVAAEEDGGAAAAPLALAPAPEEEESDGGEEEEDDDAGTLVADAGHHPDGGMIHKVKKKKKKRGKQWWQTK